MRTRTLGRTGFEVSEVGFGAWAIGGSWGHVSEEDAMATLHAAVDAGVTFIDTADVYGDGRSERLIARLRRERPDVQLVVATKCGRQLPRQTVEGYHRENLDRWVDGSRERLEVDTLDLVQLHCPPWDAYYQPELFAHLEDIKASGRVAHWGVSVEKVEEALKAIEYPVVETVQIILNAFRQRPTGLFLEQARRRQVGVLARVPLASGLLTGKMDASTTFPADDHRTFNREGASFDVGETFGGVPFEVGLEAVDALRPIVGDEPMARFALRWVLTFEEVSTVIPGARRPDQATANASASDAGPLSEEQMAAVREVYDRLIAPHVHHRW